MWTVVCINIDDPSELQFKGNFLPVSWALRSCHIYAPTAKTAGRLLRGFRLPSRCEWAIR